MKKTVYILLISMLLAVFSPFSVLITAEEEFPTLWDGSSADGFAGGRGSEKDPFRIETAEQLAYFRDAVNNGETFVRQYVRLCADIRLNDESFSFVPDTGLVMVTDGTYTAYFGSGWAGDDSGINTVFDKTPASRYEWYDKDGNMIDGYQGTLFNWKSIGVSDDYFRGTFDGAGHTISGMYIGFRDLGNGLFSSVFDCTLVDLHVASSVVASSGPTGGLVGKIFRKTGNAIDNESNLRTTIRGCSFDGVVVGSNKIGGIVGSMERDAYVSLCENKGTVVGSTSVGGVMGSGTAAKNCLNRGNVYGSHETGGIVGGIPTGTSLDKHISEVGFNGCTNKGNVIGGNYVGGIAGCTSRFFLINDCHNTASVYGSGQYVGGICGDIGAGTVSNSYNAGRVEGEQWVGGIVGYGSANKCYNAADVVGKEIVGGVVGGSGAAKCSENRGNVTGDQKVGGAIGVGTAYGSCNYGTVTGNTGLVGGVAGTSGSVRNCYNQGTVTGNEGPVGGLAGALDGEMISNYNVGSVTGRGLVGALVGSCDRSSQLMYCYYRLDCATDSEGVLQSYHGSSEQVTDVTSVAGCTLEEMMQSETYAGFTFGGLGMWQTSDTYPIYADRQSASHTVSETVDEAYLYQAATCTEAAQYRTSCVCSAVLDEIVSVGEPMGHQIDDVWQSDEIAHWHTCQRCGDCLSKQAHTPLLSEVLQDGNAYDAVMICGDCGYTQHIPFEYEPPAADTDPLGQTPTKAEFKIDLRFLLLLSAGAVLGAMGCYGVLIFKKSKQDIEKKKKDFV